MKKYLYLFTVAVIIVLLMLSSCTGIAQNETQDSTQDSMQDNTENTPGNTENSQDKAKTVIEQISQNMEPIDSFTQNSNFVISGIVSGSQEMNIEIDAKTVFIDNEGTDPYYYNRADTNILYEGSTTELTVIEAYTDGMYLISHGSVDNRIRLFSYLSPEEFSEYYLEVINEEYDVLDEYGKSSYVKNEDGSYVITLEDFSERMIAKENTTYGEIFVTCDVKIDSIVVKMYADANLILNKIEVDYIFNKSFFNGKLIHEFSDFGSASKVNDLQLDPTFFSEINNLTPIMSFDRLISRRGSAESGKFTIEITQTVKRGETVNSTTEVAEVTYGTNDNGYYFSVYDPNDETEEFSYVDGVFKEGTKINSDYSYNDLYARLFANSYIDPFEFVFTDAEGVETSKDGKVITHTITLSESGDIGTQVKRLYKNLNLIYDSAQMTLSYSVCEGRITELSYTINAKGHSYGTGTNPTYIKIFVKTVFLDS